MFEPMGGSAPKYTGKNVINPLAAIMAGAMMLEFIGEKDASIDIERAVKKALKNDIKSLDAGKMGMGTKEVGDLIVKYIME
ncbi:MAG TPA: isocitrate/isopropylmalate family dehydrogenase, partial [Syntrophorhabdaceae bacterium]|nr:isocitrate/isopropylmalate family dehydrogenase [Syntrophorhabdaceae bacterium]